MSDICVRQAHIDEIPRLFMMMAPEMLACSAIHNTFDVNHTILFWQAFYRAGVGTVFVLEIDYQPVGMLGAIAASSPHTPDKNATEMFWFVLPNFRGHGILLIEAFEKWAKECGCKYMALCYMESSMPEKLQAVYKRRKYKIAEVSWIREVE